MKITPDTAATLGEKIASLELTQEEGVLLTALLAVDDEVEGFGKMRSSGKRSMPLDQVRNTYAPVVSGPIPGFKVEIEGGYTEVEWTY